MTSPADQFNQKIITALAATGEPMSDVALRKAAGVSFFEAFLIPLSMSSLSQQGLVQQAAQKGHYLLTVEGERAADKFRGLSQQQTGEFEQKAAAYILHSIATGKPLPSKNITHLGTARRQGLEQSLLRDGYVAADGTVTERGQQVLQRVQVISSEPA